MAEASETACAFLGLQHAHHLRFFGAAGVAMAILAVKLSVKADEIAEACAFDCRTEAIGLGDQPNGSKPTVTLTGDGDAIGISDAARDNGIDGRKYAVGQSFELFGLILCGRHARQQHRISERGEELWVLPHG